jgi:hypothetical protein
MVSRVYLPQTELFAVLPGDPVKAFFRSSCLDWRKERWSLGDVCIAEIAFERSNERGIRTDDGLALL